MIMGVVTGASAMLGQTVIFLTALFYLLGARSSCTELAGELLLVIDQSKVIYRITELVVRAVLLSALKMSAYHALFTWLMYSWGQVPIIIIPTVLSALVALIPLTSPVYISIWASAYLWFQNERLCALLELSANIAVWWQVP